MLRIFFTDQDLARTTVATQPDPLWDIACSLHLFQSRQDRWRYSAWYRAAGVDLVEARLDRMVRSVLLPILPRAAYFPDFLTPPAASEGLAAGLEAILACPRGRVRHEVGVLDRVVGAPDWAAHLPDGPTRRMLVDALRAYHDTAIAPHLELIQASVDADRANRARAMLDGGIHGLLHSLRPQMRWEPPVLSMDYVEARDLHLNGRGLRLVPSYFCFSHPIALADPDLPQTLIYPLHLETAAGGHPAGAPLAALLGRSRADILQATTHGATTGELARLTGVSPGAVSRHTATLRDTGLVSSHRRGNSVLHTLTPLGASLLRGTAS